MTDSRLVELIDASAPDLDELKAHLDGLTGEQRGAAIRRFSKHAQARLFEAAGGRRVELADIVPADTEPLTEVICDGWNSLPLFRSFQKRFCRDPDAAPEGELWGYNEQAMRWATGPGYFVARQEGEEVAIDYTQLPSSRPSSWPAVLRNDQKLSRWIYNGTIDFLRPLSAHVTIGRATRAGKPMDNWFVLCRRDRG